MNKTLIALFLTVSLSVNAKPVVDTVNQGGGKIVLTDEGCRDGQNKLAYSIVSGVSTLLGCWTGDGEYVHIKWYDNDLRSYPYAIWRVIDSNVKPNL